jgi:hypothetical protein
VNNDSGPSLLNEKQAADFLNMSVRTLQAWRVNGRGPAFVRLSAAVRYSAADLEMFIRDGRRLRTHAPSASDFR